MNMENENNKIPAELLKLKVALPCPNGCGATLEFEPDHCSERPAWSASRPHTCPPPKPKYKDGWYRTQNGEMVRRLGGLWNALGVSSCYDDNYATENWAPLVPVGFVELNPYAAKKMVR